MRWFSNFRYVKYSLVMVAAAIAAISLFVSSSIVGALETHVKDMEKHVKELGVHVRGLETLVDERRQEELNKMELWVEAMSSINSADENTDLSLAIAVLESNNSIPVVVLDNSGNISLYRNIELTMGCDTVAVVNKVVEHARMKGYVITMEMAPFDGSLSICYDESLVLSHLSDILASQSVLLESQSVLLESQSDLLLRLSYYPYIQLAVVVLFFVICIFAVLSTKRAEQNRVWVGLSKETAHQLGTPISSLMAWTEVLKEQYPGDDMLHEMERDVARLQRVAERFSKIGSKPESEPADIVDVVEGAVGYVKRRSPAQVQYESSIQERPLIVPMNAPLIEWVLENLCKNAVDAMNGNGKITVSVSHTEDCVCVDVSDTGKGIPKSCHKRVFEPGYTTKKRGWGLGLSLAKRIVEQYHGGRIFVKNSTQKKGTTFRIELKK